MRIHRALVLVVLLCGIAGFVTAQTSGVLTNANAPVPSSPKAPDYGTVALSHVRVTAAEFTPYNNGFSGTWAGGGGLTRYPTGGTISAFEAPFHAPGGSLLQRLEFDFCDNNASSHMTMNLIRCDNEGQNCSSILPGGIPLASTNSGCTWTSANGINQRIDNYDYIYTLEVIFGASDGTNLLSGAIVGYQLDVSPAPGSATFADVSTGDPAFQFIEALSSSGITSGCGGGNYCPDATLTRRQMAVFLAKALSLHWVNY